ncbi:MAG TPA: hypothetical protein VHL80_20075 [Polyangia bacterium]|nr:hypothetical protein [Polyangia bacterium]
MPNKLMTLVGIFVLGLGALAATTQGCGGGSSAPSAADIASVCNQACTTEVGCSMGLLTMDACVSTCTSGAKTAAGTTCSNTDAIVAAAKQCAAMTNCAALGACFSTLPKCATGSGGSTGSAGHAASGTAGVTVTGGAGITVTGTGGVTGGGGITITGGGGITITGGGGVLGTGGLTGAGTTCATACVKADACCNALGAADAGVGMCMYKSTCDLAPTAQDMSNYVLQCNGFLIGAPAIAEIEGITVPDACK